MAVGAWPVVLLVAAASTTTTTFHPSLGVQAFISLPSIVRVQHGRSSSPNINNNDECRRSVVDGTRQRCAGTTVKVPPSPMCGTSSSKEFSSLEGSRSGSEIGEKKERRATNCSNNNRSFLDVTVDNTVWRRCRSVVLAAAVAASTVFLFNTDLPSRSGGELVTSPHSSYCSSHAVPQMSRLFRPRSVLAVETSPPMEAAATAATIADDETHNLLEEPLPTHDAIGTMSSPSDATHLTPLRTSQRSTVLDEVWSLVNKYYIDQTFNGKDWSLLRDKYEDKIGKNDITNDDKLMRLATDMVNQLGDKYSRILDAKSYAAIQKFDMIGVGATLMPNPETKRIMVGAPPVPGSSADNAGIKYGDFITAVNGVPTKDRTAFDIIDQITENPNANTVTMTVVTEQPDDLPGEGYARDITLTRTFVPEITNPISYKVSELRTDGTKVGYVRIKEFNSLVKDKLEEALKALETDGTNAYVLDLRGNRGGAFQSAVEIAGLFVEDKVATNVVDSNSVELPFRTAKGRVVIAKHEPLVLWIDGNSASATEVLAGALRDNCRAVVMGDTSFGKGLIQAVYGLKNGAGLVLTVARYVTPNGTDIQGYGITPDVDGRGVVPPSSFGLPFGVGGFMNSDTTHVDFGDVRRRLTPEVCPVPPQT